MGGEGRGGDGRGGEERGGEGRRGEGMGGDGRAEGWEGRGGDGRRWEGRRMGGEAIEVLNSPAAVAVCLLLRVYGEGKLGWQSQQTSCEGLTASCGPLPRRTVGRHSSTSLSFLQLSSGLERGREGGREGGRDRWMDR